MFLFGHSQGDFSFDALFGNLVNDLLPSFLDEEADSGDGHGNIAGVDGLTNGHLRGQSAPLSSAPFFPEVDGLLSLFKDACKELVDLRKQVRVSWVYIDDEPFFFLFILLISEVFVKYFGRLMEGSIH